MAGARSGDTKERVRVVSDRVVGILGVLARMMFGLACIRVCNLLPMPVSVGGLLVTGSHSSCLELKSPTVMHFLLEGFKTRF